MIIEAIFFKIAFSIKKASAKEREGAGREPCGLRKSLQGECRAGLFADLHDLTAAADAVGVNSELGSLPHHIASRIAKVTSSSS